jgi:hypothetical protein
MKIVHLLPFIFCGWALGPCMANDNADLAFLPASMSCPTTRTDGVLAMRSKNKLGMQRNVEIEYQASAPVSVDIYLAPPDGKLKLANHIVMANETNTGLLSTAINFIEQGARLKAASCTKN